ncbi:GolD/DthD family dehydrogenase [Bradyrhizobium iriomotense]|uniref:D-threitol dehydrogenase n=1 Tax=Bradyrhizobium iriomotense TaxID=441950 RepID=A0ABQ6ASN2_9BRAD|nr:D-threitol dehydrogenase [Bradyrhizobium iriomotense]GLR85237.1 D-threitol dehydrogenase [Bradyrhizobium iriomotense]
MADFSGLTTLITGAAGGIGVEMAKAFAAAGARLVLVDVVDATELANKLGGSHRAYSLDLQNPRAIADLVPALGKESGIDVLINNAGLGVVAPAEKQSVEEWDRTQAINLRAPWLMAVAALPYLKRSGRGRIINIASQAAIVAIAEHAAYAASKAGLVGLTKVLALEWAQYGITVNAISPTVVETPMAMVGWSGEKGEKARKEIPVGRFAQPGEIASAAVYLASKEAGIITGENLIMDGGYTIR